jgi:protein-tyrosine phosphatase
MKILMVCLGNICRSPLAEGILADKVAKAGLNWEVDSAGTYGGHAGERADKRSVKVGLENDIDIKKQRSRQFRAYDLEAFDIIYAMDSYNLRDITQHAQNDAERAKVKMIMNELNPGENIAVPDPYYGEFGFENVFKMLDKACEVIIEKYK